MPRDADTSSFRAHVRLGHWRSARWSGRRASKGSFTGRARACPELVEEVLSPHFWWVVGMVKEVSPCR